MYTILINGDNSLTKTVTTRIMHRSNMVDKIHFLTNPMYKEYDMRNFKVCLEYVTPISRKYSVEILTPSTELYKDMLEYQLPVDTGITSEPGNVEIKFTFTMLDMLDDGTMVERVRNTDSTTITVIPVENWSDYISESDLGNIAEIMLAMQSQSEQLKAYAEIISSTKADNIKLDKEANEIYLTSGGTKIGNSINADELGDVISEADNDGLVKVII